MPWSAIENLLDTGFLDVSSKVWKAGWGEWKTIDDVLLARDGPSSGGRGRGSRAGHASPRRKSATSTLHPLVLTAGGLALVIVAAVGVWWLLRPPANDSNGTVDATGAGPVVEEQAKAEPEEFPTDDDVLKEVKRISSKIAELEHQTLELLDKATEYRSSFDVLTHEENDGDDEEGSSRKNKLTQFQKSVEPEVRRRITQRRRFNYGVVPPRQQLSRQQQEFVRADSDFQRVSRHVSQLASRLQRLNAWTKASFVLVNGDVSLVGVHHDPEEDDFEVIAKASGVEAVETLGLVRNAGIPRIDRDRALSREVFSGVAEGEVLDETLAARVRQFWQAYDFVKRVAPTGPLSFVHFRELASGEFRFGVFTGFDGNRVGYQPVGRETLYVERDFVDRESAVIVRGTSEVSELTAPDFLDFCVLSVASRLSERVKNRKPEKPGGADVDEPRRPNLSQYIRVAIHVDVDAFRDDLAIYRRATSKSSGTGRKKQKQTTNIRISINRVRNFAAVLTQISRWSKADAERFLLNATKDPELRRAASFIEDEIYTRFVKLGVPILEREEIEAVVRERSLFRSAAEVRRQAGLVNATHLVLVELKPSQTGNAAYHLSVRLVDVNNGAIEWAGQGERFAKRSTYGQSFYFQQGRLAVVTLPTGLLAAKGGLPGKRGRPVKSARATSDVLAHISPSDKATEWMVRPLQRASARRLSKAAVHRVQYVESGLDVPRHLSLNYALDALLRSVLPPAGKVISVDNNKVMLEIGQRDRVRRGDQIYLIREAGPAGDGAEGAIRSHLSTRLSVVEVSGEKCQAVMGKTGFEEWWMTARAQPGDIGIVKRKSSLVVGVTRAKIVDPDVKVLTALNFRNRVVRQRLIGETNGAAERLQAFLESEFLAQQVEIATAEDPAAGGDDPKTPSNQFSHLLEGSITLSPLMAKGIGTSGKPVFRVILSVRNVETRRQVSRVEFDWDGRTE